MLGEVLFVQCIMIESLYRKQQTIEFFTKLKRVKACDYSLTLLLLDRVPG